MTPHEVNSFVSAKVYAAAGGVSVFALLLMGFYAWTTVSRSLPAMLIPTAMAVGGLVLIAVSLLQFRRGASGLLLMCVASVLVVASLFVAISISNADLARQYGG